LEKNEIVVVVREYPDQNLSQKRLKNPENTSYHIIMPELLTGFFTKEAKAKGY
jgi:hypothetical protein